MNLAVKPVLNGEFVQLRPFLVEEDMPYIEECLKDPVVLKYTGSEDSYDKESVYKWYASRNEQSGRLDLAIVDKARQVLVGEAVVNLYNSEDRSMNFRILIGPGGRDRGLGTEATRLLIDYMFEKTDVNSLTLSVFAFNPRAVRVYEKAGFETVSIDKGELEHDGKWIDSINMKLTRENWEKRREQV
ncbi:GNAT family N-acetyltransferase [Metabacillus indicus]|uniref:GNAT family N-acetyltransferase n=1 Tax=Metabacillus TaxID=2675233 RepID=UPI001939AA01|nr:GNAT family protein [Metabacillus sp. cB07]